MASACARACLCPHYTAHKQAPRTQLARFRSLAPYTHVFTRRYEQFEQALRQMALVRFPLPHSTKTRKHLEEEAFQKLSGRVLPPSMVELPGTRNDGGIVLGWKMTD